MANANRPSGLSPVMRLDGSPWNGRLNLYYIPSTDNNAYAIGDPVKSSGSGSSLGVPGVTLATAGHAPNPIRGVIVTAGGANLNPSYVDPNNLGAIVIPATKTQDYYVGVCDDPWVVFAVQESGTNLAADDIGLNADLASGVNNGYLSGWTVNGSSKNASADYQVRLLGLQQVLNNAFGDYAKWLVLINTHELKAGTAGL